MMCRKNNLHAQKRVKLGVRGVRAILKILFKNRSGGMDLNTQPFAKA
jgi:hypothetical protein